KTYKQIARDLGLAPNTVRHHIRCFFPGIFPLIMDSGCRLMRIFFISLIRNWSKVRPFCGWLH
ncbi:hypothetical protein, partial [Pseudomonas aeruginosa]|uniref:hypothetical protein n=1 Tax=Pseudomonas aeruginosa TaxID=287 RepID=UPI003D18E475